MDAVIGASWDGLAKGDSSAGSVAAAGAVQLTAPPATVATTAAPVPAKRGGPEARNELARALKGGDSDIVGLSDAALAIASPAEKTRLLKTLIKSSRPNQQSGDSGPDQDQSDMERAIVRILGSAPDAASFDYAYYRAGASALDNSGADTRAIRKMVEASRASVVPGDWAGLDRYVDTVADTKSSGKNIIEFLIDGSNVMLPAQTVIQGATKSINLEVFQFQADEIGWAVAKMFAAKTQAGVHIRMMVDEHGSNVEHDVEIQKLLKFLRDSGVAVIVKKPPIDESHLDHRKVMVVDGETAFTGGMNIGKLYQEDWHDQQTLVIGPAVARLQDAFVERWRKAGGSFSDSELVDFYPAIKEPSSGAVTRVVRHTGQADQNIKAMYLRAFGTAEKSIRIANPYFMDPDVVAALERASQRHVKVQIILPQDNDMPIVQRGARSYYPDLLKAGVEIYEYKGRMAHEKVCVIDGIWSTFGSSNLDARSLWNNDEMNLVVSDPATARFIERNLFDVDIQKSERITKYSPTLRERLDRLIGGWL